MNLSKCLLVSGALFFGLNPAFSQYDTQIQNYLDAHQEELKLTSSDLSNWSISDHHTDKNSGITFVYLQQELNGIPVYNSMATLFINNGVVSMSGNRLHIDLAGKANTQSFTLSEVDAIQSVTSHLGLTSTEDFREERTENQYSYYNMAGIALEPIRVHEVFVPQGEELILSYEVSIYILDAKNWWNVRVDATTGEILDKNDWVAQCSWDDPSHSTCAHPAITVQLASPAPPPPSTDQYRVFAEPVESPNHGPRTLEVGPFDAASSPFGWHDDNGVAGEEYTITRGNNVYAYEDANDNNQPGFSPDGGPSLDFDFPLDLNQDPSQYQDVAITNLFYWNNKMHDVWYHYGFDEVSGNFQEDNYGNGGAGSDYVRAEAQDGGGTNNANFATPNDGSNPRMQMYLWDPAGGAADILTVNAGALAGGYSAVEANFGPPVTGAPITSNLVVYDDNVPDEHDACEAPVNGGSMNGNIVILRRGSCNFVDKIQRAQDEGATAVIVVQNTTDAPFAMGGTSATINIPSVMISQADGEAMISDILGGGTVNATLVNAGPFSYDGDFDNGIICHEYGHGISNRLTGGPGNSSCLGNEDQMGEGWSDWFGLMMTIEPGDQATDVRGIGTFASGEPITGGGIRPAPYSTDPAVNSHTFSATNSPAVSMPHGIGFVWCSMLWDMTWLLIDEYGYDSDLYNGTGGNNIAMDLVMMGMKLQPCSPGFVDGRDAILAADNQLYGGAHQCLIWNAFANRGLGYSADQGDPDDRFDQVQAFDLPPAVNPVTDVSICGTYTWAVNGQTYNQSGVYTDSITTPGCEGLATLNLTIETGLNATVTQSTSTVLFANESGVDYQWVDCDNGYAPIAGATGQAFAAIENGNFAVIVSFNGCQDTSECFLIDAFNSLIENEFGSLFSVSPNPTSGAIEVVLGDEYQEIESTLYDALGREIDRSGFNNVDHFNLELMGAPGTYTLAIRSGTGKIARIKLMKLD